LRWKAAADGIIAHPYDSRLPEQVADLVRRQATVIAATGRTATAIAAIIRSMLNPEPLTKKIAWKNAGSAYKEDCSGQCPHQMATPIQLPAGPQCAKFKQYWRAYSMAFVTVVNRQNDRPEDGDDEFRCVKNDGLSSRTESESFSFAQRAMQEVHCGIVTGF
jgi:hypothetical protein